MHSQVESARKMIIEAFDRMDVEALAAAVREEARLHEEAGEFDRQFAALVHWAVVIDSWNAEAARRMVDDAEQLLPLLKEMALEPLMANVLFWQMPREQLPPWPHDPYEQRVTQIARTRILLSLSDEMRRKGSPG